MDSEGRAMMGRALSLSEKIGADVEKLGGVLRCWICGHTDKLEPGDAGRYIALGWPKCHDLTMHWWTQRQIDAGEMPS